jgi:hypothetical protein
MTACLLLAACAAQDIDDQRERLAQQIEQTIVLPTGAEPLRAYGRNYAFRGKNLIVAFYLIPFPSKPEGAGCTIVLPGNRARACTREEETEGESLGAQAGTSRWYDTESAMPQALDGGCQQVSVLFQISTRKFVSVACNGVG